MSRSTILLLPAVASTLLLGACSLSSAPATPSPTVNATVAPTPTPSIAPSPAAMHGEGDEALTDERSFLMHMIPHHEEAVSSAQQFVKRTKNAKLAKIANGIIATQTKEIADMKTWFQDWFKTPYVPSATYEPMMPDFDTMEEVRIDARFMQNMIAHHQDAVTNAREAKAFATRPELKRLLDAIILSQTKEINEFKSMLSAMGEEDHDDTGKAPHDD